MKTEINWIDEKVEKPEGGVVLGITDLSPDIPKRVVFVPLLGWYRVLESWDLTPVSVKFWTAYNLPK